MSCSQDSKGFPSSSHHHQPLSLSPRALSLSAPVSLATPLAPVITQSSSLAAFAAGASAPVGTVLQSNSTATSSSSSTCSSSAACRYPSPSPVISNVAASESVVLEVGDEPNQPATFSFPKRKFGETRPVYRYFQAAWFKKWPWIHNDQVNDRAFCFTCGRASRSADFKVCASKGGDAFLIRGYYNWKDACGEKRGGFASYEHSNIHKYCVDLLAKPPQNVADMLSDICRQMAVNRNSLRKVLENVIFLAQQGLPFRGNWVSDESGGGAEVDSNFYQLLLHAKDDPGILEIMQREARMYTDHHIQNELMQIMTVNHLRKIAAMITEAGYFSLEADEVTDSSNKEQVIVCLRWVDAHFEAHEEFIGLHHVADITTDTIVAVLKDTVLRMRLNLSMCRGQCYDGVKKAAKAIKEVKPKALYLHCYGHSLNLAVADTLKHVSPLSSTLDHCLEICKLIKFSHRRDAIFNKLKTELSPHVPGLRNLCPTRWTVRVASLESIRLNYLSLLAIYVGRSS